MRGCKEELFAGRQIYWLDGIRAIMARRMKVLHVLCCLLVAGCSMKSNVKVEDSSMKRIKSLLPEFEKFAQGALDKTKVPGMSIGIVCEDEVIYMKSFGVKDVGTKVPVDLDTIFPIGSCSKPITGSLFGLLVSEGKVNWTDKVVKYFPSFQLYDPWVTKQFMINDLLCHRSGLPTHTADMLWLFGYSRDELIKRLRFVKPTTSFRSHWDYQNCFFAVAGVVAEKIFGKSWESVVKEKLFMPLGMNATSADPKDFVKAKNKITPYALNDGKLTAITLIDNNAYSPSGGVNTNIKDIVKWLRFELNGGKFDGMQIVKSKDLKETHAPQIPMMENVAYPSKYLFYALGWVVEYDDEGNTYLQHQGALDGIRSFIILLPEKKTGIAILSNAFPSGMTESVGHAFFDLFLHGKISRDWVQYDNENFQKLLASLSTKAPELPPKNTNNKPSFSLEQSVGRYYNDYIGDIAVSEKNGRLSIEFLVPAKFSVDLDHWNGDLFVIQFDGDTKEVLFKKENGQVRQVTIKGLVTEVEPVFTRKATNSTAVLK